jgi:hypothetical protein
VLVPSEKFYSTLRSRTAEVLDQYRWLAPAATAGSVVAVVAAIALQLHLLITLAAACSLLVTAFVWGYSTRRLRVPPWPTLAHLNRRQYAETWDTMASSSRTARIAVAGKAWEWELRDSAAEPIRNLAELVSLGSHRI